MDKKTEEALNNIKQVCATFVGNLQQHGVIQASLKQIEDALNAQKPESYPTPINRAARRRDKNKLPVNQGAQ